MEKKALNPFMQKALMGLGLLGAGGAGGFYLGNKSEDESLKEQGSAFNEYNQEENQALANDAFMQGVEFALKGDSEKTSNYKGSKMENNVFEKIAQEAFTDELNKIALKMGDVKSVASKAFAKAKEISGKAVKETKTIPENARLLRNAIGSKEGAEIRAGAKNLLKSMRAPAAVVGTAGLGYKLSKKD